MAGTETRENKGDIERLCSSLSTVLDELEDQWMPTGKDAEFQRQLRQLTDELRALEKVLSGLVVD